MVRVPDHQIKFYILPQTWYGRLLAAVVGAIFLLLLIFFFTLFLIIFALLAIFTTIYMFLFSRKSPETTSPNIIQVEYLLADPHEEPKKPDRPNQICPPK